MILWFVECSLCANHTQQVLEQKDEQFQFLFRKWFERNRYGTLLHDACQYLDLSSAQLVFLNLRWTNLCGANLSEAYLIEANLSGANLSEAYLSGANLSGADLSRANLSRANLSRADLSGADLTDTIPSHLNNS